MRTAAGPVAGWGGSGGAAVIDGWEAYDATTLTPKAPYQDVRVRNLTVTGTAVITSTTTSTGQFLGANGTAGAPSYSLTNSPTTGFFRQAADVIGVSIAGTEKFRASASVLDLGAQGLFFGSALGTNQSGLAQSAAGVIGVYGATTAVGSSVALASTSNVRFSSTTDPDGTADLYLVRNAANELLVSINGTVSPGTGAIGNIRVGQVKWGTPAQGFTHTLRVNGSASDTAEIVDHGGVVRFSWNQSATGVPFVLGSVGGLASPVARFIQGEGSRAGTDNNVGGANLTVRPGLGTGTGTASSFIVETPTLAASGTGAQTYTTRVTFTSGVTTLASTESLNIAGAGTVPASGGTIRFSSSRLILTDRGTDVAAFNATVVELATAALMGWGIGSPNVAVGRSASAMLGVYGASASVGGSVTLASDKWLQFSSTTDPDGTGDVTLYRSVAGGLGIGTTGAAGGGFLCLLERTAPAAAETNGVRIYAVDNGAGKTQLMAIFQSGAAQQIAIEP